MYQLPPPLPRRRLQPRIGECLPSHWIVCCCCCCCCCCCDDDCRRRHPPSAFTDSLLAACTVQAPGQPKSPWPLLVQYLRYITGRLRVDTCRILRYR